MGIEFKGESKGRGHQGGSGNNGMLDEEDLE